ncbi:MAG: hypothetical protein D6721_01085 [Gammaproteobacteria bacterium]|nr:MAG: hypothetical protein D6721_01085 [Gammaproteobacteria bacterium]
MAGGEFLVYRAWMLRTIAVVALLLFLLGGGLLYEAGLSRGRQARVTLEAERDRLHARVTALEAKVRRLEEENVRLRRAGEIDRLAVDEARERQAELEEANQELLRELHFYRSVMAPDKAGRGLVIREFTLTPQPDGRYRLQLLLVQTGRNDRTVRGRLQVRFLGRRGDRPQELTLAQVSVKGRKEYPFRLKYFQAIEDLWRLPEGFRPQRIRFRALVQRAKARQWDYAWPGTARRAGDPAK